VCCTAIAATPKTAAQSTTSPAGCSAGKSEGARNSGSGSKSVRYNDCSLPTDSTVISRYWVGVLVRCSAENVTPVKAAPAVPSAAEVKANEERLKRLQQLHDADKNAVASRVKQMEEALRQRVQEDTDRLNGMLSASGAAGPSTPVPASRQHQRTAAVTHNNHRYKQKMSSVDLAARSLQRIQDLAAQQQAELAKEAEALSNRFSQEALRDMQGAQARISALPDVPHHASSSHHRHKPNRQRAQPTAQVPQQIW